MPGNGHIVDAPTIVDNGNSATRFDIVILGDGFQQKELDLFDEKAELLATRLLAMPPFDEVADLINVHTVRTVSTDSGVSKFPTPKVSKKTFYDVTGHFDDLGQVPSFLGTPSRQTIWDAAERVAPLETLEVFIVLANVKALAASADPPHQMMFTGLHATNSALVNYTAHELCHAIARTAEEYLDGNGPTVGQTFLNQATEEQRVAGTVWWKSLAKASELKANGDFRAVHQFGDPNVHFNKSGTPTPVFDTKTSLNGKLGLYWGCQNIDPSLPGKPKKADFFTDPRGRNFYRAMAKCKMRDVTFPFCRVCSALMLDQIRASTL